MNPWESAVAGLLDVLVVSGAFPVVMGIWQYLLVPAHSFRNHFRRARPYLPRVAVVVPAWNEGVVIGRTIDRLMTLQYPAESLRIYVVDDASTDDTPDVVRAKVAQYPGRVLHLRREQGGEGKAHTLNHGIEVILRDEWMEALLITDADVIFRPDSLRRMARHLADPDVGAVTAYIREGSRDPNYLTRFIAYEYVAAQMCARRAQNVLGAVACLAGGAQLHSRENLLAIGGRIDTSSLAEDTFTTFHTQLTGKLVVFEPTAIVLAEEPGTIDALWKQRLRWARGNVQVTSRFKSLWFRPSRRHRLGSITFGLIWFSLFLMPFFMIMTSAGLIGTFLLEGEDMLSSVRYLWLAALAAYVLITVMTVQTDIGVGLRVWREALLFPGVFSLLLMAAVLRPRLVLEEIPGWFGLVLTDDARSAVVIGTYAWVSLSMVAAWGARRVEGTRFGRVLAPTIIYLVGYGPLLCAITFDSYVKEWRGAAQVWDKTEKTGRVTG